MINLTSKNIPINSDFTIINSAISNNAIYSDDTQSFYFVLHKSGFGFIFSINQNSYINFLSKIYKEKNIPDYFHIYDANEKLVDEVKKNSKFKYWKRKRIKFEYTKNAILKINIPNNISISQIHKNNYHDTKIFESKIEKFWESKKDFLKNGFGNILYYENQPASIFYTAAVNKGICEIETETVNKFRNMDLGEFSGKYFINLCKGYNIIPNWDCFEDNLPSIALAKKLGFFENKRYNLLSILKGP